MCVCVVQKRDGEQINVCVCVKKEIKTISVCVNERKKKREIMCGCVQKQDGNKMYLCDCMWMQKRDRERISVFGKRKRENGCACVCERNRDREWEKDNLLWFVRFLNNLILITFFHNLISRIQPLFKVHYILTLRCLLTYVHTCLDHEIH